MELSELVEIDPDRYEKERVNNSTVITYCGVKYYHIAKFCENRKKKQSAKGETARRAGKIVSDLDETEENVKQGSNREDYFHKSKYINKSDSELKTLIRLKHLPISTFSKPRELLIFDLYFFNNEYYSKEVFWFYINRCIDKDGCNLRMLYKNLRKISGINSLILCDQYKYCFNILREKVSNCIGGNIDACPKTIDGVVRYIISLGSYVYKESLRRKGKMEMLIYKDKNTYNQRDELWPIHNLV